MLGTAGTWCTYIYTYTPHLISPLRSCSELLTDLLMALLRPGGGPKANVGATAGDHGEAGCGGGEAAGTGEGAAATGTNVSSTRKGEFGRGPTRPPRDISEGCGK